MTKIKQQMKTTKQPFRVGQYVKIDPKWDWMPLGIKFKVTKIRRHAHCESGYIMDAAPAKSGQHKSMRGYDSGWFVKYKKPA